MTNVRIHRFLYSPSKHVFYFSCCPNSWFLDLDITEDAKKVVAAYTHSSIHTFDISLTVSHLLSVLRFILLNYYLGFINSKNYSFVYRDGFTTGLRSSRSDQKYFPIGRTISSSSLRLFRNEGWPLSGHERVTEARLLLRLLV